MQPHTGRIPDGIIKRALRRLNGTLWLLQNLVDVHCGGTLRQLMHPREDAASVGACSPETLSAKPSRIGLVAFMLSAAFCAAVYASMALSLAPESAFPSSISAM